MRLGILLLAACFVASAEPIYLTDTYAGGDPFQSCTFPAIEGNEVGGWCAQQYITSYLWFIDPSSVQTWDNSAWPQYDGLQYIDVSTPLPIIPWSDSDQGKFVGFDTSGSPVETGPFMPEYDWDIVASDDGLYGPIVNPNDPCSFPDVICPYVVEGGGYYSAWRAVASLPPLAPSYSNEYFLGTNAIGTYVEAVPEPSSMLLAGFALVSVFVATRFRRGSTHL